MQWFLGVMLLHTLDGGEHPVAFASCRLTKAERNSYSQIEKEVLVIVVGVKKFHKKLASYLCDRWFSLITNHKPLLSILCPNIEVPSIAVTHCSIGPSSY